MKRVALAAVLAALTATTTLGAPTMAASDPKLNVKLNPLVGTSGCAFPMEVKANFWRGSAGFDLLTATVYYSDGAGVANDQEYKPNHIRATWHPEQLYLPSIGGIPSFVINWRVDALLDGVVMATEGGSYLCEPTG